jgi:hypothetical protein
VCFVRAVIILVGHAIIGLLGHLVPATEDIGAEQFSADAAVEGFDVSVLGGLSRLDVGQGDAVCSAPVVKLRTYEPTCRLAPTHGYLVLKLAPVGRSVPRPRCLGTLRFLIMRGLTWGSSNT